MKIDDSKVESFAKKFRQQRREIDKACRESTEAQQAMKTFQAEIDRLGEPDYRDDAAIEKLAKLQLKLKAAERSAMAGNSKVAQPAIKFQETVIEGAKLCVEILGVIAHNRLETVTGAVRMFSRDAQSAKRYAQQSDACRSAQGQLAVYSMVGGSWRRYVGMYQGGEESPEEWVGLEFAKLIKAADKIEEVLFEATDRKGDIMRLLPMFSADPYAPVSEAKAGADDESDDDASTKSAKAKVAGSEPSIERSSS